MDGGDEPFAKGLMGGGCEFLVGDPVFVRRLRWRRFIVVRSRRYRVFGAVGRNDVEMLC